jgi:flagellar operon protein
MAEPFRVQLDRLNGATPAAQPSKPAQAGAKPVAGGTTFAETLAKTQEVRFSNHAQKRLETRDIQLSEDNVNRLSDAIDKAEKRGGKNSLVMVDDMAFIVNVRERLVVTALDSEHRGEGVFTQIDSVVFADPASNAPASGRKSVDRKG